MDQEKATKYDAFISYSHSEQRLLASSIQNRVQKFGKSWYQRRRARIFRDESNLSANPDLWGRIELALADSGFLILLASTASAKSEWVTKEITYWLENREIESIILAICDGTVLWNSKKKIFEKSDDSPIPEVISNKFKNGEPLFVDLRDIKLEDAVDDPKFNDAIATIASEIHGVDKDEIFGQDLQKHRQALSLAVSGIIALVILFVLASALGLIAEYRRELIAQSNRVITEQNNSLQRSLAESRFLEAQRLSREQRNSEAAAYYASALSIQPEMDIARVGLYNKLTNEAHLHKQLDVETDLAIQEIKFSKDGLRLIANSRNEVLVYDAANLEKPPIRIPHLRQVMSSAISPNGDKIVTAATTWGSIVEPPTSIIKVWDLDAQKAISEIELEGVTTDAQYLRDGAIVVANSFGPRVFDGVLSRELVDLSADLLPEYHQTRNVPTYLALSGDRTWFAWGSGFPGFSVFYTWDSNTWARISTHPTDLNFHQLSLGTQSESIVIGGPDPSMMIGVGQQLFGLVLAQGVSETSDAHVVSQREGQLLDSVTLGPTGFLVLSAFGEGEVELSDLSGLLPTRSFSMRSSPTSAAFSADGLHFAIADEFGQIDVIPTLGFPWRKLSGFNKNPVDHLSFSPLNSTLATASKTGRITLWSYGSAVGKDLVLETESPRMIDFWHASNDGDKVLVHGGDRFELWSTSFGQQIWEILGYSKEAKLLDLDIQGQVAIIHNENQIDIADLRNGLVLQSLQFESTEDVRGFISRNRSYITVFSDSKVSIFRVTDGALVFSRSAASEEGIRFAQVLRDEERIFISTRFSLEIWSLSEGQKLIGKNHNNVTEESVLDNGQFIDRQEKLEVIDVQLNEDVGRVVLMFGYEGAYVLQPPILERFVLQDAAIFSLDELSPIGNGIGNGAQLSSVNLSRNGEHVIGTSVDGAVRVVNTISGEGFTRFDREIVPATASFFSSEGDTFALVGRSNEVRLFSLTGDIEGRTTLNLESNPLIARFLGDGRVLATVSKSGLLKLWDVDGGVQIANEIYIGDPVKASFSDSGDQLTIHLAPGVVASRRIGVLSAEIQQINEIVASSEKVTGLRVGNLGRIERTTMEDMTPKVEDWEVARWYSTLPSKRTSYPGSLESISPIDLLESSVNINADLAPLLLSRDPLNRIGLKRFAEQFDSTGMDGQFSLAHLAKLWGEMASENSDVDQ